MGRITVRFSDDEEATIRHHMKLAGETNISAYVRRVCLEGAHPVNPALGSLHKQVDSLVDVVGRSHKLLGALATQQSENLELKILAGVYMLLYRSVEPAVQALVDVHLDRRAVEAFLAGSMGSSDRRR